METVHDSDIVYENEQGLVWIKTDETEAPIIEMPCTSFPKKKAGLPIINPLEHCAVLNNTTIIDVDSIECDPLGISVNERQNGIDIDAVECDPLDISVNQKQNRNSSMIDQDIFSPIPLKHYSRRYYERNEMILMNSRTFICSYCGHTVFTRKELVKHISSLHNPNHPEDSIIYLTKSIKLWDSRTQKSLQCLKISRIFFCSNCDYRSLIPLFLRVHLDEMHIEKPQITCTECGFSTVSGTEYKAHMITHVVLRPCEFCNYKSASDLSLEQHFKRCHSKEEIHKCALCNFKSVSAWTFKRHMKTQHAIKRTYSCPHCPYKSTDSTNLKRHVTARHGVKPHNCPKCKLRFMSKKEFATHVVNKHRDFLLENKNIKDPLK